MNIQQRVPLTHRGWIVTGVIVGAIVLGILFGARSLNAVAAPATLAIVLALWRFRSLDRPSIDRASPAVGYHGETHTVTLTLDPAIEYLGHIHDAVDSELAVRDNDRAVPLDAPFSYDVTLSERGRHTLGPTMVEVEDLLGLATIQWRFTRESEVLVYPRIHPITYAGLDRLAGMTDITLERERHEFDRLREYQPQDSLRDIHWKTSAKRPDTDFIVKEFIKEHNRGAIVLSGEAKTGADDALAEALASLSYALVEAGVHVGLHTADGHIDPIQSRSRFGRLLLHLAELGPGVWSPRGDVHLRAMTNDVNDVMIEVGDETLIFGNLREDTDTSDSRPQSALHIADPVSGVAD